MAVAGEVKRISAAREGYFIARFYFGSGGESDHNYSRNLQLLCGSRARHPGSKGQLSATFSAT